MKRSVRRGMPRAICTTHVVAYRLGCGGGEGGAPWPRGAAPWACNSAVLQYPISSAPGSIFWKTVAAHNIRRVIMLHLKHSSLSGWGEAFINGHLADRRLATRQMHRPWARPTVAPQAGDGSLSPLVSHPAYLTTGRAVSSSSPGRRRGKISLGPNLLCIACRSVCIGAFSFPGYFVYT